ncbi:MAG: SusE domain-containing protein [Muribaculaceae bacterium]|nr:SusE domain-containing protein [Muribaculaceae bacterium]
MKKLSIFLSALAILGLSACEDDKTPVVGSPDSFTLNTPPTAEQYYDLTPEGTIALSCSQPDYGFTAAAIYSVEVSLDKENVMPIESNSPSSVRFTINEAAVSLAMCQLMGVDSPDNWADPGYMPLYVRAVSKLTAAGAGEVRSNWIELAHVKPYFAVPTPGYIYLIGACSEWSMDLTDNLRDNWRLYEQVIGSKIYYGTFDIPAGQAMFRFYTELDGDWDTYSYGPCNNHGGEAVGSDGAFNVTCEFTDGEFEDGFKATKDNFNFVGWKGGKMTIEVNMHDEENMYIKIAEGEHEIVVSDYVYMVGNNGGWETPSVEAYDAWKLADSSNSGIYSATFDFAENGLNGENTLYCRFYKNPNGWGAAEWASTTDADYDVVPGVAVPTKAGEGCFVLADAGGHSVTVTLDTNNNEVTFTINN